MKTRNYETKITEQENSVEYNQILSELRKYNRSHVEKDQRDLSISLFDENKKLAAGLNGATYYGWLFVEHLWVREDCRKDGLGRGLLKLAEEEARKRGCRHVYLDTFSFQAPGFYAKQGYSQYAKLDEFPGKHSRYFFKKDLVEAIPFHLNEVRLELPDSKYKVSYLTAIAEMKSDSERSSWIYLGESEPYDTPAKDFEAYVNKLRSTETNPLPSFVTSTCYWAVHKGEVIGRIAIRHELNDFLKKVGGHVGYIVRPSYRNRGVASEMLRLILETDRARSIGKILVTCDENNTASERTILKNGGILENITPNGDQPGKKRFWIDSSKFY